MIVDGQFTSSMSVKCRYLMAFGATKARMTDEGFVILAGSIAPGDVTGSFPDAKKANRQKLIDKGVIEVRGAS